MTTTLKIAKILKLARVNCGLTQRDVSKKLKLSAPQFIHLIEQGKSKPPFKTLGKMIEIYGIDSKMQREIIDLLVNDYKTRVERGVMR